MSDELRRVFNRVDRLFDRRSISAQTTEARRVPSVTAPVTARSAFEHGLRSARTLDRGAVPKMIVSPNGLLEDGVSDRWEMFFDLPDRRAKVVCDLQVLEAEEGRAGGATLTVTVRPFPSEGGLLRKMVDEGKLLHRQLAGHWRQEMRKSPALPTTFKDSDEALAELEAQGLDAAVTEFSFGTAFDAQGKPKWRAAGRHDAWETSFAA